MPSSSGWLGKENRIWKGNFEIKNLTDSEWVNISKNLIDKVVAMGYDGILINGISTSNVKTSLTFLNDIIKYAKALNPSLNIAY